MCTLDPRNPHVLPPAALAPALVTGLALHDRAQRSLEQA